jgi:imidazoleglycerol phosphate dehydratase HisB
MRRANVKRSTNETDIAVTVDLTAPASPRSRQASAF